MATQSDYKPLFSRRHSIIILGIDITQIPELIGLYDAVRLQVYESFDLVWNNDEQLFEGEKIDEAVVLIMALTELMVRFYKVTQTDNEK
jgi:hypothetical protein